MFKKLENWLKHADNMIKTGTLVFEHTNKLPVSDKGATDEKLVALTLLCRTISNFKATLLLLQHEHIAEARTLARNCFENLFYVGALREEGYEFVKKIGKHDLKYRQSRGESLFATKDKTLPEQDWEAPLREYLAGIKDVGQTESLTPKGISKKTAVAASYVFYEQFSSDSAHPTTDSLSRYILTIKENDEEFRGLDINPIVKESETVQTIDLTCCAMLGVIVGVNEILGGTNADSAITHAVADRETLLKDS